MDYDKRILIMRDAPVARAILKMSLPVVVGMLVQVLYNLVDTFFIGQLGDFNKLAGTSITTPVIMMMIALVSIVGTGGASYLSRSIGADNMDDAKKTLSISFGISIVLGIFAMVFGIIYLDNIVLLLGASKNTYQYTYVYVLVMFLGSIPIMLNFLFGQILRAEGSTMFSMMGMFIGTAVNIVLDPIFIFLLDFGVTGAAIATVLANVFGLCYYIYLYRTKKTLLNLQIRGVSYDKHIVKAIFAIGFPSAIAQFLVSVAFMTSNNIAASYSDVVVASMGIAQRIMTIGVFSFMGFGAGCQPLIGYNYGAKNHTRVLSIIRTGIVLTFSIGTGLMLIFMIFAPYAIGIFTTSQEVVNSGIIILRALALCLPFMGGGMLCITAIQSMGKAVPALILSVIRQGIVFIPLLFLLNTLFGFNGFIYAQAVADVISIICAATYLIYILKKEIILKEKVAII